MSDLSIADEQFAAEVAVGKTYSDAYRISRPNSKAKDETVWQEASRIANDPRVAARIKQLKYKVTAGMEVTVERVLRERARLAFFDPRAMLHGDGTPKGIHELDDDVAAAISGFDIVSIASDGQEIGRINKIKLADKNASLTALEKHLGMYKDNDNGNGVLNIHINLGD